MKDKEWFSVPEFAKLLGYHRNYVWQLVKAGLIKAQRCGGYKSHFKIPKDEAVKWGLLAEEENPVDLETG